MTDFKQIVGRGTRVYEEKGKLSFEILDYTNSTRLFADPDFDGEPARIENEAMDDEGQTVAGTDEVIEPALPEDGIDLVDFADDAEFEADDAAPRGFTGVPEDEDILPRKFFYDGGLCEVIGEVVYQLDPNGNRLRSFKLVDYTKEQVRTLYRSAFDIQQRWVSSEQRSEIIDQLGDRGIDFEDLKRVTNQPDADPFDLLCHLAFDAPVLTCRQRAERLRSRNPSFFEQYGSDAKEILEVLLQSYTEWTGTACATSRLEGESGGSEVW